MTDLKALTITDFENCLNQPFQIKLENGTSVPLELTVIEKRGGTDPDRTRSQAFSLLFLGPDDQVVPQQVYTMTSERLGEIDIFIVPIGDKEGRIQYEAIFN